MVQCFTRKFERVFAMKLRDHEFNFLDLCRVPIALQSGQTVSIKVLRISFPWVEEFNIDLSFLNIFSHQVLIQVPLGKSDRNIGTLEKP